MTGKQKKRSELSNIFWTTKLLTSLMTRPWNSANVNIYKFRRRIVFQVFCCNCIITSKWHSHTYSTFSVVYAWTVITFFRVSTSTTITIGFPDQWQCLWALLLPIYYNFQQKSSDRQTHCQLSLLAGFPLQQHITNYRLPHSWPLFLRRHLPGH